MNPWRELQKQGQSIWLDYISRELIRSGELKRLVEEDGLSGVTSNPTIFEKAIGGSADYDDTLRDALARDPHANAGQLYERLAIEDIRGDAGDHQRGQAPQSLSRSTERHDQSPRDTRGYSGYRRAHSRRCQR